MNGRDRPGPATYTAVSAKDRSSNMVRALSHPKDCTDRGSKERTEENRRSGVLLRAVPGSNREPRSQRHPRSIQGSSRVDD
jgi:hypothetical protein